MPQLAILQQLRHRGCSSPLSLAERLYQKSSPSQHLPCRSCWSGWKARSASSVHRAPDPTRSLRRSSAEELIGRQLQQTANKLPGGSSQPLVTHLVQAGRLSADDRKSLRSLLDELNGPEKKQGKR